MTIKIALTLFVVHFGGQVIACKCDGPLTVDESYQRHSIIVHGKVVNKQLISFEETMDGKKSEYLREQLKDDKDRLSLFISPQIYEIQLVVKDNFKGSNAGDTLTIYTSRTSGSCGVHFEIGGDYIVYSLNKSPHYFYFLTNTEAEESYERENTLWVHACTRTAQYSETEAKQLRNLKTATR